MNRSRPWMFTLALLASHAVHAQAVPETAAARHGDPDIRSFTADRKARAPGDMLTVLIVESAQVSQTARTQAKKKDSATATLRQDGRALDSVDAGLETSFDGSGTVERSGRLLGKLAVSVESVDEYGNLHVVGRQVIDVNNEKQEMRVEGRVRPEDIGPDNTILSWRVSDAKIALVGKGFLTRKQSPGLIAHLLSFFGV